MSALAAIAAHPPDLDVEVVSAAVASQFGLEGSYESLVGERDQNFRLDAEDGRRFVVKVTSLAQTPATTDFQIDALRHLETANGVPLPRIVPTIDGRSAGEIACDARIHRLRIVSWVGGKPLAGFDIDDRLASRVGSALARLDDALLGFAHPADRPVLLWDLQRVAELLPVLDAIEDRELRLRVTASIDDYVQRVAPHCAALRTQVIHGDANPDNVLVDGEVIGFIDFGDSVRAPRIFDLGIAASYQRAAADDPLRLLRPFVLAYHAASPLEALETELLFDLVRARLATTVALLFWRLRDRPADDPYRQKSLARERDAAQFLGILDALGRERFNKQISGILHTRRR